MSRNPVVASLYREATTAAGVGLAVNLALGVIKLVGGLLGHSFSLISDAVNSLGDAVTTVVVLIALRVAQRPPDEEHPYGHTRAEAIAGSNVAMLIMVSAVVMAWQTIRWLGADRDVPHVWTLWIAGGNAIVKEVLYRYQRRVGERTRSSALIANAWDHRSDALCAGAVFVGLTLVRFGGPHWELADPIAAIVVAAAIFWSGLHLFRSNASELMDVQADDELVSQIRAESEAMPGVAGIEKLRVRKSGLEYFADLHVEVAPRMTVADGHQLGHDLKDRLMHRFPTLSDVLVHLEPHGHSHHHEVHDD